MADKFPKRTVREKIAYHNEGEKRILAKTKSTGMTANEKDARSAGYMAHVRESIRMYVWANATEAEREAMKTLQKDKTKRKNLWDLERSIKERAKAANTKDTANVKTASAPDTANAKAANVKDTANAKDKKE